MVDPSPLKRVQSQPKTPRFISDYTLLLTPAASTSAADAVPDERFFDELFCLPVSQPDFAALLAGVETRELIQGGKRNESIRKWFSKAVAIFKTASEGDVRRDHVVETLQPFMRDILSRKYDNFAFDVLTMLGGSLDGSDAVLSDLVIAIDETLQSATLSNSLKQSTLQLVLVMVAGVNQGSLNAYFLRRDLFTSLIKFASETETPELARDAVLTLALLSNYRKYETRNPYLVRIEDLVDETAMSYIIDLVTSHCMVARDAYTHGTDDSRPSFVASLSSLFFLSPWALADWFRGNKPSPAPGSKEASPKLSQSQSSSKGKEPEERDPEWGGLPPPELITILLPFYDLVHSNKVFGGLLFSERVDGPSPVVPTLISLSSYVACHASASNRARCYARLCLILLLLLVSNEDGEAGSAMMMPPPEGSGDEWKVRLCRQRQPMLPFHNDTARPLVAAVLDTAVIFLRHNLSRKMDIEGYIIALKLVQRVMQQLKTDRIRLEYDWVGLWRSLMSTSTFIAAKIKHLRTLSPRIDELISQIFILLSYAAYWGDAFFASTETSVMFYYEVLRSQDILANLSDILGITSIASPGNSQPSSKPETPLAGISAFTTTLSPRRYAHDTGGSGAGFKATECISNIRSISTFFSDRIDDVKKARGGDSDGDVLEAEEVFVIIEANLGAVELIESDALNDLERYNEREYEGLMKELVRVVNQDVSDCMP